MVFQQFGPWDHEEMQDGPQRPYDPDDYMPPTPEDEARMALGEQIQPGSIEEHVLMHGPVSGLPMGTFNPSEETKYSAFELGNRMREYAHNRIAMGAHEWQQVLDLTASRLEDYLTFEMCTTIREAIAACEAMFE